MGHKPTVKEAIGSKIKEFKTAVFGHKENIKEISDIIPPVAPDSATEAPMPLIDEEKVEVLIKESVMINPRDFSAFKHALEEFVANWDK